MIEDLLVIRRLILRHIKSIGDFLSTIENVVRRLMMRIDSADTGSKIINSSDIYVSTAAAGGLAGAGCELSTPTERRRFVNIRKNIGRLGCFFFIQLMDRNSSHYYYTGGFHHGICH